MEKLGIGSKKVILYFSLFLAILFSYFALLNVKNINIKGWKGYHILLVEKNMDNDNSIYTKLQESNFFDEIISEYNTEVAYTNYNSLSYITVDKIEKRFKQQDPRFDNFIRKISGYFRAYFDDNLYSVYYLKTEVGYSQTFAAINSILENNYSWIMPKYENYQLNTILLFLYILILLIFVYNNKKQWFIYMLHATPWAFLIYLSGKIYFFTALVMLFVLMLLLLIEKEVVEEYVNNKTISLKKYLNKKSASIAFLAIFSFMIPIAVSGARPAYFITPISMLLFEFFFIISKFNFTYHKVTGFSHKIFYATRISKEKKLTIASLSIKSFTLIYFLSIATLPFYFIYTGDKNLKYPLPAAHHKYPESELTLEFLKKISLDNVNNNYLPDYSEYIKHLAYQIRLPYKIDYSIPFNNEEITISNYYLEKNNYKLEKIRVNQFTDIWLNDNIAINKGKGITGLMLSNTGLIQAEAGAVVPDFPLFIIPLIFGFLYPILFYSLCEIKFIYDVKNPQIYGTRKKIIPVIKRRKQQAA
ncbi:MAG: hypothetical protein FWE72_03315 [Spirochaetaceae bacterium]|nr:hypothetical protein [Spirochaetaceae bacterium]